MTVKWRIMEGGCVRPLILLELRIVIFRSFCARYMLVNVCSEQNNKRFSNVVKYIVKKIRALTYISYCIDLVSLYVIIARSVTIILRTGYPVNREGYDIVGLKIIYTTWRSLD